MINVKGLRSSFSLLSPSKVKWLGLAFMGMAVFVAIISGALAFNGIISVDNAISFTRWGILLLGVPGFVLHIVVVRHLWNEKRSRDKAKAH